MFSLCVITDNLTTHFDIITTAAVPDNDVRALKGQIVPYSRAIAEKAKSSSLACV